MAYVTLIPIVEGSLARASEVMGNFQGLADAINGNLDGSNIQDGSITAQKIVNGAITSGKLAANSVVGSNIANGTITGDKFAPGAVGQASIVDGSITEEKLADNSVSRFKLQDSAVSAVKIANSAVTSSKIEDDSITGDKIRDSVVSLRHMDFIHGIREIAYLYVGSDGTILQGGGLPSGASFSRVSTGTYRITGLGTMSQSNRFLAIGSTFSPSNRFIGAGAVLQGTLTVTTVDSSGNPVDAEFGMILIRGV